MDKKNKQEISGSSSKGKATTIVVGATQNSSSVDEDVFALARQIEEILKGKSNRTCSKVLNMVGSLHGLRTIPADRPIGQSTTGATIVVPKVKQEKGLPTPKAAWKQTDSYRNLSAERTKIVNTIKSLPATSPNKEKLVEDLRAVELSLKQLKSPTSGN